MANSYNQNSASMSITKEKRGVKKHGEGGACIKQRGATPIREIQELSASSPIHGYRFFLLNKSSGEYLVGYLSEML